MSVFAVALVRIGWLMTLTRFIRRDASLAGLLCIVVPLAGCSRGPAAVHLPDVDPSAASEQAIEMYDTNGDVQLSATELAACPGILAHIAAYDTDKNHSVSREEVEEQIVRLRASRTGLTSLRIRVRMNGKPLKGAKVKLVPEKYLGEEVKTAWGTTNARGSATMDVKDEDLPSSEAGLIGVHYGTYKVEVTHPNATIPAKYNTQTSLGYETEKGNPSSSPQPAEWLSEFSSLDCVRKATVRAVSQDCGDHCSTCNDKCTGFWQTRE